MKNQNLYEYKNELVLKLTKSLNDSSVLVSGNKIRIFKVGVKSTDLKKWLDDLLKNLPQINHPLETVELEIYENGKLELITKIN